MVECGFDGYTGSELEYDSKAGKINFFCYCESAKDI